MSNSQRSSFARHSRFGLACSVLLSFGMFGCLGSAQMSARVVYDEPVVYVEPAPVVYATGGVAVIPARSYPARSYPARSYPTYAPRNHHPRPDWVAGGRTPYGYGPPPPRPRGYDYGPSSERRRRY
jgi:hypothetical protein